VTDDRLAATRRLSGEERGRADVRFDVHRAVEISNIEHGMMKVDVRAKK